MRWEGRRQSSNIQDMRGTRSRRTSGYSTRPRVRIPSGGRTVRAGGGGIGTIVILVVLFFALRSCGIDPLEILAGGGSDPLRPDGPADADQRPDRHHPQ